MSLMYNVQKVEVTDEHLVLTIDDHQYWIRLVDTSPLLCKATPAQRRRFDVSPSGYGIHWADIDEDLAIRPLLKQAERVIELATVH